MERFVIVRFLFFFLGGCHVSINCSWFQMNETDTWSARIEIQWWQQAGLLKISHHYPRVDSSETTRAMTVASAPRFRHALRQAWARARAHTRHTPDVCAHSFHLGHGCVQEVKNDINTVRFSHTNRSFCVLGHQCVVTMGNCLIWISLCMFFFSLIETVTYTCHYMTDRLERFDLKTSNWIYWRKKTPTSWMPLG